jgi:hypothetical protein
MRLFLASALLAAAPLAAVAAPAMAAPVQHFTQDGEDYSYTASRRADGVVVLRGTVDSTGDAFNLRVRGTRVDGSLGMSNVSFQVSRDTATRLASEVPATGTMSTALAAN